MSKPKRNVGKTQAQRGKASLLVNYTRTFQLFVIHMGLPEFLYRY